MNNSDKFEMINNVLHAVVNSESYGPRGLRRVRILFGTWVLVCVAVCCVGLYRSDGSISYKRSPIKHLKTVSDP